MTSPPWRPAAAAPRLFSSPQVGSWAIGALQLRSGFPPRADFDGGGRQRFLFFARADTFRMVGFYVFMVRGLDMFFRAFGCARWVGSDVFMVRLALVPDARVCECWCGVSRLPWLVGGPSRLLCVHGAAGTCFLALCAGLRFGV